MVSRRVTAKEDMASRYYSTYYKNVSNYPYVSRVPVGKDGLDFIYQFAKNVEVYSIPHNYVYCTISTAQISGPPTTFPNYENLSEMWPRCDLKHDVPLFSWQKEPLINKPLNLREIFCYLEITFHEAVYPLRVSVYETFNPGSIIQICAEYSDNTWCLLWDGCPQTVPWKSRLFSPPLDLNNLKTKKLRLYLNYDSLRRYHTVLDAILLIGTSEMISPRNSKENLTILLKKINCKYTHHEDVHNLTPDYKNANLDIEKLQNNFHKYCILGDRCKIISQELFTVDVSPISQTESHRLLEEYSSYLAKCKLISENLTRCSFSALPDEIILKILKKLDFKTLSRMSQVNKHFNNLSQDPFLYTCLNMRGLYNKESTYISNIFCYLKPKCKYLKQLDLAHSHSSDTDIIQFINNCGEHLTHLRLKYCLQVNDLVISTISKKCENLKELDIRGCLGISDKGLSYLKNLKDLEHLKLGCINNFINAKMLCKILKKLQQMRELSLTVDSLDDIYDLRIPCQRLEIINLRGLKNLTSEDINVLANCKNLRKVKLLTRFTIADDVLHKLLFFCQYLKEVHLTFNTLTDRHLLLLTQCKNLEYLYLYHFDDGEDVSLRRCSSIFELCPRVKFYFVHCMINSSVAKQWIEKYPHVFVQSLF